MTDRELLEFAAKAAEIDLWHEDVFTRGLTQKVSPSGVRSFNPLESDGDALRLAVKLELGLSVEGRVTLVHYHTGVMEEQSQDFKGDPYAATRRAIVRAAAEIGKDME